MFAILLYFIYNIRYYNVCNLVGGCGIGQAILYLGSLETQGFYRHAPWGRITTTRRTLAGVVLTAMYLALL